MVETKEIATKLEKKFASGDLIIRGDYRKDTGGYVAGACRFPHKDPDRLRLKEEAEHNRQLLTEYFLKKIEKIQKKNEDNILTWMTRGLRRSLMGKRNFAFLEVELIKQLKVLYQQKPVMPWTAVGHVARLMSRRM